MYVAVVLTRLTTAILLRESYREAGKTKNRTSPTCRDGPPSALRTLRRTARRQTATAAEAVEIVRALPHGHVLAALGTARRLALDAVLPPGAATSAGFGAGLIVARLLERQPSWRPRDAGFRHRQHSLGEMLGLGKVAAKEVYAALDWLGREQRSSKPSWPVATCRMARCCSTTSPRPISKGGAANWRSMATAATTGVTGRKLSSA